MSFISVFDVLGPNMIGLSSSHTAGAAAIARINQAEVDFTGEYSGAAEPIRQNPYVYDVMLIQPQKGGHPQ